MKKESNTIKNVTEAWRKRQWGFYDLQKPFRHDEEVFKSLVKNAFIEESPRNIIPTLYDFCSMSILIHPRTMKAGKKK